MRDIFQGWLGEPDLRWSSKSRGQGPPLPKSTGVASVRGNTAYKKREPKKIRDNSQASTPRKQVVIRTKTNLCLLPVYVFL